MNNAQRNQARFVYAGPYATKHQAEVSLHDSFAEGDVCPADLPEIEKRANKYVITVKGN